MNTAFDKRILTVPAFAASMRDIADHLDDLQRAAQDGRVDRAFTERVMLAVTEVNGCRYCSFVHTQAALLAGVTSEEIRAILTREFGQVPPEQVAAMMFAQHYAETGGHPDPNAWQHLIDDCGMDMASDVMVYIRLISLANLWGNTFDALLSRFAGRPAPDSSLVQELGVVFGWAIIVPVNIARRLLFRRRDLADAACDRPASIV